MEKIISKKFMFWSTLFFIFLFLILSNIEMKLQIVEQTKEIQELEQALNSCQDAWLKRGD